MYNHYQLKFFAFPKWTTNEFSQTVITCWKMFQKSLKRRQIIIEFTVDTRQKSIIQKLFIRSSESLLKIRFKFSTSYVSTLLLSILKLEATGIKTMVIMAFVKLAYGSTAYYHLTSIYLFKVNNWNTRTLCQISSKLTINTPELYS